MTEDFEERNSILKEGMDLLTQRKCLSFRTNMDDRQLLLMVLTLLLAIARMRRGLTRTQRG